MKYRKKPVVIEAEQFDPDAFYNETHSDFLALAVCGAEDHGHIESDWKRVPHIHTLEGSHMVRRGDWVIRGVKGEFYPCRPDIFASTYEPVDSISEEGK